MGVEGILGWHSPAHDGIQERLALPGVEAQNLQEAKASLGSHGGLSSMGILEPHGCARHCWARTDVPGVQHREIQPPGSSGMTARPCSGWGSPQCSPQLLPAKEGEVCLCPFSAVSGIVFCHLEPSSLSDGWARQQGKTSPVPQASPALPPDGSRTCQSICPHCKVPSSHHSSGQDTPLPFPGKGTPCLVLMVAQTSCRGQGRSCLPSLPWKAPHLIESRDNPLNGGPGHTNPSHPDIPNASKSQGASNTSTHSGLLASLQSLHPHPQSQWNTLTGCQRARPATLQSTREARLEAPAWEGCARQVMGMTGIHCQAAGEGDTATPGNHVLRFYSISILLCSKNPI